MHSPSRRMRTPAAYSSAPRRTSRASSWALIEDLGRALLRCPDELSLLEHLDRLLLRTGDDRVTLLAGALGDPPGLLGDPARLAHLLRHGDAQLVDQLEQRGLVEDDVVREGQLLAGGDQRLQPFDEEDDVRGRDPPWLGIIRVGPGVIRSRSAVATGPGSMAVTSPPNCATSFASEELT